VIGDYFLLGVQGGAMLAGGVIAFLVIAAVVAGVLYALTLAVVVPVLYAQERLAARRAKAVATDPPPFSDHHNHHLS
jgi:hypothetical protein